MKVSINDLQKGDVVLTCIGTDLVEVKLLRQPQLAKLGKKKTWSGVPRWTSIPCALRLETTNFTTVGGHKYSRTKGVIADDQEYNCEKRIDFSERVCWLIKRETK